MGLVERTSLPALVLAVLALLAGCAASGPTRPDDDPGRRAAELQVKLGQGYLNQGDLETARDKLQRALELDPESVDAHTVMAVLQERIGRLEIAETHYRRAVELKPDGGAVNNNYGSFLCGSGRYEDARPYFDRAVRDPFYRTPAVAYANAGFCALKVGNAERAEAALRSALQLDPRHPDVLIELARLHLQRGDTMRARAFLQRYEAVAESGPGALLLGFELEQRSGDAAAAARYREELQRRFPAHDPTPTGHDGASP